MKPNSTPWLPVAAVLGSVTSLCVGSSYAKTLFPVLGPQGATAFRLAFAAILLMTVWRPWRWALSARDARNVAAYGVVLGAMNLLFYEAIARIPLAIAIAIEFAGPLTLAIVASRKLADFVWIAFAVVGLALLLPIHAPVAHLDPLGVGFALAAGLCWALYIITGQRVGTMHGGQATALGILVAVLVVLPFGAGPASVAWGHPSLWLAGLAVGVLSSAVPYSLEMVALKRLPKQTFGILLSTEPMVGALVAWVMLHEVLTPMQGLAIACIVVASVGTTWGVRRTEPAPLAPTP